uniref:NADH dehydrogenase subunit 5 n=1 Tax=Panagrolaimus sp. JU765 TaxID=591449 RepID=A0AC34R313_9BILA
MCIMFLISIRSDNLRSLKLVTVLSVVLFFSSVSTGILNYDDYYTWKFQYLVKMDDRELYLYDLKLFSNFILILIDLIISVLAWLYYYVKNK